MYYFSVVLARNAATGEEIQGDLLHEVISPPLGRALRLPSWEMVEVRRRSQRLVGPRVAGDTGTPSLYGYQVPVTSLRTAAGGEYPFVIVRASDPTPVVSVHAGGPLVGVVSITDADLLPPDAAVGARVQRR